MSIELKQAAQQALEALQGGTGNTRSWHLAMEAAIAALRTAIQQAESEPGVPDGWVVVKRNAIESALQHVPYRGETWSALNAAMLAAAQAQKGGE